MCVCICIHIHLITKLSPKKQTISELVLMILLKMVLYHNDFQVRYFHYKSH